MRSVAEAIEVPLSELTHEQVSRATLRVVLDMGTGLSPDETARVISHIEANTARLRSMTAALTEGTDHAD